MASPDPAKPRIAVLDGLRGLAIGLVLVYHLHEYVPRLWPGGSAFGETGMLAHLLGFFWVGVDLFYVLSGFFIGSAVLKPARWSPLRFFGNRLTRILPAYYVSIVLTLLLVERGFLGNTQGWVSLLLHVFMLHSFQEWSMFQINGPYWTLGIEFVFYAAMLALAPLWRARAGWKLLIGFLVVCYIWRASLLVAIPPEKRYFVGVQIFGMLDEFAMGMLVALAHHRQWLAALGRRAIVSGLAAGLAGTLLVGACLWHYLALTQDYWTSPFSVLFSRTLLCAGFALWIVAFLLLDASRGFQSLIVYSGLGALGHVSYSVYLYHIPAILLLHRTLGGQLMPGWWLITVYLALTLMVAYASFRWVESRWHRPLAAPAP